MIFTDTHCHLYLEQFEEDLEAVLNRAAKTGIKHIMLPAIDFGSIPKMEKLSHPEINFYKMAGIHPCSVEENLPVDEESLIGFCEKDDFIGVGETGLDYYWSKKFIKKQKESLRIHCRIAKSVRKPVILHNRDSTSDLLSIIEDEQDGNLTGIWHCFTGSADEGRRAIDLGLHLGLGGVLTFKNSGVDQSVRELPLEKMILETDAPYLAPVPNRGKRNEPACLKFTAEKLAEIKDLGLGDIAEMTTRTACEIFKLN